MLPKMDWQSRRLVRCNHRYQAADGKPDSYKGFGSFYSIGRRPAAAVVFDLELACDTETRREE